VITELIYSMDSKDEKNVTTMLKVNGKIIHKETFEDEKTRDMIKMLRATVMTAKQLEKEEKQD